MGRALGIPRLFVLTTGSVKVTPSTWPLPLLQPRRKELAHRGQDHLPGEPPSTAPRPTAFRGTSPFPPRVPVKNVEDKRQACQSTSEAPPPSALGPRRGTHANRPQPDPPGPAGRPRPPRPPAAAPPGCKPGASGRLPPPGPPPAARRPAAASARPPRPLTALTGRPPPPPPPPRRGLTRCPPPCPRRSPVSTPKPSGRAAGAGR